MTSITVQIDDDIKSTAYLNLEDKLSNVREQLEQNSEVKLNDALSFSKKISQEYASIAREGEGETKLKEIVELKVKILYLKSEPSWNFFNYNCKLEYGYTVGLSKSNRRAFKMVDCEMTEIEGSQIDTKEIDSMNLDRIEKTNLLTNIQDFAKLGVPIETSNIKKSKFRTNTYNISEYSKVALKFKKLEPTEEFIKTVEIAIESKDLKKFKDITKEFGQFIPKEVILGGRAYFKEPNALIQTLIINTVNKIRKKYNSKCEGFNLVGGKKFGPKNSNELTWTRSLEDFRNWDCIKFKDPVSIFQPLSEDLRKQILTTIGKKTLYTNTEIYSYKLSQPGMSRTFELKNIPENILEILRNEDAECNIFPTVISTNKSKDDVFHCQIHCPPNDYPRLGIHCIQNKFKERKCKLKIRLTIIGYDVNFSFNYPKFNDQLTENKKYERITEEQTNARNVDIPENKIDFMINNHFVKFINMCEFSTMTNIDGGHFGTISKALWKKTNSFVACKRLKDIQSICHKQNEAFLHELQMHKRLDFCSRIIRILGISFDNEAQEYLLIMQYADGGNLRKYLQKNFSTLTWYDKINLAYQIAEGLKYLHGENILHRDLHSKNVVIHQGEAKIIDLGTAKSMETETNLHSGVFGVIPYIDPKVLEDFLYKYNKKSDIYSLGVLMWELSSGKPPFIGENENVLSIHLIRGRREDSIPNTPTKYLKLYQSCWNGSPDLRPSIDQVFTELGRMLNIQDFNDNNDDRQVSEISENEQINDDDSMMINLL